MFKRYAPPTELGQVGQTNNDGGYSDFQSGTEEGSCPTSESSETRTSTDLSHLSHSEEGGIEEKPSDGDL